MNTEVATRTQPISADLQEKVLLGGDLSKLTATERLSYYNAVCTSLSLNPLTRPFEYLTLNGKMVLYARKDCTDQLRREHGVSVEITSREVMDGVFVVTAQAKDMTERKDESIGAVPLPTSTADKANAMMKAETKAKRRVTLSICGLGMLDESEIETIRDVKPLRTGAEMLADLEKREPPTELETQLRDSLKAQEEKKADDAPALTDDPAEPYRAKIRTAHDEKEARAAYEATPETLKQDTYSMYLDKLKDLGKKPKK